MLHIGIVEDDIQLNNAIKLLLEKQDYQVTQFCTFKDIKSDDNNGISIYLIDIGLPDATGFDVARYLKNIKDVVFVFITAQDDEVTMLEAYDLGCFDYIVKPFSMNVLLRKIEVIIKNKKSLTNILKYRLLEMNIQKHEVKVEGKLVNLTANEFAVLELLMKNEGLVISRERMLEKLWDEKENYVDESSVTVTISRLKKKLGNVGKQYIHNVFKTGYRFGEEYEN